MIFIFSITVLFSTLLLWNFYFLNPMPRHFFPLLTFTYHNPLKLKKSVIGMRERRKQIWLAGNQESEYLFFNFAHSEPLILYWKFSPDSLLLKLESQIWQIQIPRSNDLTQLTIISHTKFSNLPFTCNRNWGCYNIVFDIPRYFPSPVAPTHIYIPLSIPSVPIEGQAIL